VDSLFFLWGAREFRKIDIEVREIEKRMDRKLGLYKDKDQEE